MATKSTKTSINKARITKKIFWYACSLLFFNFLLISLISNFFLDAYSIYNKEKYLYDIYDKIVTLDCDSEKFLEEMKIIQYENIYVTCYDHNKGEIIYSNINIKNTNINKQDISLISNELLEYDFFMISPKSEYEENLYNITGRQQQITLFGRYLSKESNKYIILQTSYQPILDITNTISRFNIVSGLMVLAISIFPTMAFAYLIAKPIKEATAVARNIKNKDFSQRCIIRSKDEIADLGEAINIMADSIATYTTELESANEQLTSDITNRKKIEQAQKEFVSNVSHEIKTPISIISGYAEGIKQGLATTDEEREEFCDIIIDECQRMTDIVVELLSLSKLENGTVELDYSNFNINELCEIIISKFKLKCQNAHINMILKADKTFEVRADYNEIEKVLINYFQNAYKHVIDNGTISFILKEEGEYVYIGVNNDGIQIPEEEINNIWNKFYKVDKSHKREENSTGLGLSIVKATMDLHKMPYGVKNTENGVEFYIKLQKGIEI